MSTVRKAATVRLDERLFFPESMRIIPVDNSLVVLSPSTANWLCIEPGDASLLEMLQSGITLGEAVEQAAAQGSSGRLNSLLGQIFARQFASATATPSLQVDNLLTSGYFYLTNACNLACPHCYMYSGKADHQELTVDEWCRVLKEFRDLGGENVTFSGGEVLAKKGWLEILSHSHSLGLATTILTNGTLWTDEAICVAASFISEIQISVDGPTEELNARVRGQGAFWKALETAKAFSGLGVRTSVAMTPPIDSLHLYAAHFKSFLEEHISGTSIHLRISQKLLPGRTVEELPTDAMQKYQEIAAQLAELAYPDQAARSFSVGHAPNRGIINCGLGGLTVSASGDIFPCNRLGDLVPYGNVRYTALSQIAGILREVNLNTSVDNAQPCSDCDLKYICGGGCRIDNYVVVDGQGAVARLDGSGISSDDTVTQCKCSPDSRMALLRAMIAAHYYKYG